ncbi:MAG: Druantia anti-phage system protein DruA [Opitutaceae bacterium]
MESSERVQGRPIQPQDVESIRQIIAAHPKWTRKQIARGLCEAWTWTDGRGRLKDFAARSLLMKLAERGLITLPPLRYRRPKSWAWAKGGDLAAGREAPVEAALGMLRPITVEPVEAGSADYRRWREYLRAHHYLGLRIVGENMAYLARDRDGREVGCLLFGAAAWKCAVRDAFLEWSAAEREQRLTEVTNNTRFLILPWVKVPHLASHVLGLVARRIGEDWRKKYGHEIRWLETFVERDRFRGTCYRAANWICVGQTQGRSRQDRHNRLRVPVKDVYVYRLER